MNIDLPAAAMLGLAVLTAPVLAVNSATDAAVEHTERLPGVTVEGKASLIDKSDHRLRLLQNSLPELGGNAPHRKAIQERAREYVARHRDPNQATGQQRVMMERAQTPPGPDTPVAPVAKSE